MPARSATGFLAALFAGWFCGQVCAQPASRPAFDRPSDAVTEAPPTDAERVTRLRRSIDDSALQVEELTARLNDPTSEYTQAERAFAELDTRLAAVRKALEAAREAGDDKAASLETEAGELQGKRTLAKERFDLAIAERKTLQQQIATLQQKIVQDNEALKRLKGEMPASASQPTADTASTPPTSDTLAAAVMQPAARATDPKAGPSPASANPAPAPTEADRTRPSEKPPQELVEAREEATRTSVEAEHAQAEAASVTERLNALRSSIALEQELLRTGRKKAENAQSTELALFNSFQRKWEEGAPGEELAELRRQIGEARERLREAQQESRQRADRLGAYQTELAALQAEQIAAMEQAAQKRSAAELAQKRVEHLESPLSPRNLWRWTLERGPRVGAIILAMFVVLWSARLAEGRIIALLARRGGSGTHEERENRARTLVSVFHSTVTVAVYAGGGLTLLTELGVNIVPLMGGAAVLGLAIAFGAQNLIRDYFYGFMILLENQYAVNDVIRIGDVSGQVERITLRVTTLRALDGTVHFVPNGEITRVSNMTHEWSRALFNIPVAYKEDVDRVMHELVELAKELRRDPEYRGLILEMPEMLGVDEFADSAVVVKFFVKTRPLKQWLVRRELLRRIKRRFDELGIEIPFPHRTVYHRSSEGGLPATASRKPLDARDRTAIEERSDPGVARSRP